MLILQRIAEQRQTRSPAHVAACPSAPPESLLLLCAPGVRVGVTRVAGHRCRLVRHDGEPIA